LPYHETHSTGDPRWWSVREEIRLRQESSVIVGMGIPPRGPQPWQAERDGEAQVRQAEKDGKPMHCDTYPVRLDTVRDVLAQYHRTSQEEWQRARELPEYVRRDPRELGNMGIRRMPGLLGPEQGGETGPLCWRVAIHGNEDPAQVGRIVAWELSSGEAFVEFWLGGFPDFSMFREMKDMAVQDIEYRAFWMVEKMTFESILQIQVEATLEDLDRCLREFHLARAQKGWYWGTDPRTGKVVLTSLALCPGGVVCQGTQIWCVEALDVRFATEVPAPFCAIGAGPLPSPNDEAGDELGVICWPDWNKVKTPASYRKYLGELMVEFQRRAFIRDLPAWLTEAERMEAPETAREIRAEPAAEVAQTETLPVKEDASAVSAPPPVQREPTGAPAPGQAQTELPPPVRDSAPHVDGQGQRTTIEHLSPHERYIFRRRGDFWEIAFGGEPFHLKDVKGLQYIALLLRNPHSELDVMDMVSAVNKDVSDAHSNIQAEESLDSVSDLGDNQEIVDAQTIGDCKSRLTQIKERLAELEAERETATVLDDTNRLSELDEEKENLGKEALEINKYLRDGTGFHGRSRSFPTPRTNARSSVQQAIKAALDNIRQSSPPLSEYLQSTISTGIKCSYSPDPSAPISWDV